MICANRCSCGASSSYHSGYLSASHLNQVEYLSISLCSHSATGYNPIRVHSGNQRFDNTNSSMNSVYMVSGVCISSPTSCKSSHCTFSNNKASDWVFIDSISNSGSLSSANIVNNNCPNRYGVVYLNGVLPTLDYCIFQNNQNTLFCVFSGSLEVSHSFISHSSSFSSLTSVSTSINNSLTNTITYEICFFTSYHCNADSPQTEEKMMNTIGLIHMRFFQYSLIAFLRII